MTADTPPPDDDLDEAPDHETLALLPDPGSACAKLMVDRALASHGGVRAAAGRLVLIQTPAAWVGLLENVLRADRSTVVTVHGKRALAELDRESARLQSALRARRAAFLLVDDASLLPPETSAAVDLVLDVPEPDGRILAELATILCEGPKPSNIPDLSVPRPAILRMAWRPRIDPSDYLERVRRLVVALQPAAQAAGPGLDDLHGMNDAVAWGRALARDLAEYRAGRLKWVDVDRGCLLAGPTGCGKTTFARRLAAECGVPLIATSYGAWQSAGTGHLGDVTKAIRDVFRQAKGMVPSILFVDELDSVQSRGGSRHHDEWWTAVINTLLAELDGIEGREGIVVVGATNFPTRIDPAIRRAGRLDREIRITLPDEAALTMILRVHLGQELPGMDLQHAALLALGASGADCERWVRGARQRARHAGRAMEAGDLLAEISGPGPQRSATYRRRIAVHEAGHVLVHHLAEPGSVVAASIRRQDGAVHVQEGGDFAFLPQEVHRRLRSLLAGRAAEEVVLGEAGGGAGGAQGCDLSAATHIALLAELSLGLGESLAWHGAPRPEEVGPLMLAQPGITERVERRLRAAYDDALELLRTHRLALEAMADALVVAEALTASEISAVLGRFLVPEGR